MLNDQIEVCLSCSNCLAVISKQIELQNITVKNQKKKIFAFQIGHIEIEKVTKFGGIWRPI